MRKYYFITAVATLLLFLMLFLHIKALYDDYANSCHNDIEKKVYTCIDNEFIIRFKKSNNSNKEISKLGFQYVLIDEMTSQMRDSILELAPLPKTPELLLHNINELKAEGIIRSSGDIIRQRLQDRYMKQGEFVEIKVLDSIFTAKSKISYETNFILYDDKGQVISKSYKKSRDYYRYATRIYYIGLEENQTVQLYYNIRLNTFLKFAIWTLVGAFIIICIIVVLVFVQLHTIRRKQLRLERISQTINGTIHDLKSPLAGAVMTLGLVKSVVSQNEIKAVISHSQISIRHLISNIEYLYTTAEADFMKLVLHRVAVGPDELLNIIGCVTNDLKIIYKSKSNTISVENGLTSCFTANLDIVRIESVVRNLVENALKYSDSGVTVLIKLKHVENDMIIEVVDNGWGIPHEHKKQIFKQFYRVPRESDSQRGHGIGLPYVCQIVKAHDGVVLFESEEGEGSCFTVKIPL